MKKSIEQDIAKIAEGIDRIATCLELFQSSQKSSEDVDMGAVMEKAMSAFAKANPAFASALDEMQRRIHIGGTGPNAPVSS